MTYYIYHIPEKKIGVTCDLNKRVTEQQGYEPHEYEILEKTRDIDYASDVDIEYLDSNLKPTFKVRLLSAYPTNVGAVELTYEGMDQIEFTVEMAYDIWLANDEI